MKYLILLAACLSVFLAGCDKTAPKQAPEPVQPAQQSTQAQPVQEDQAMANQRRLMSIQDQPMPTPRKKDKSHW